MNTFMIYQNNSLLLSRICSSPPSLEEKNIILFTLENRRFSSLKYDMDIIEGCHHKKLIGTFYSTEEFMNYFLDLCKEGIKYGVNLYLN